MRILVYSDLRNITHSVRPEAEIFIKMAEAGHQLSVFSPDFNDEAYFKKAGIKTTRTGQKHKICYKTISLLRAELHRQDYDIIYATNSKSIPSCAFAAIGFNAKLVCYRGTTRGLKRRDPSSFLSVLHPRVDAVICVSNAVQQAVSKKLIKKNVTLASIFKGHELNWYTKPPVSRASMGYRDGDFIAIAAARFRPSKGLEVLIEAAGLLTDLPDFHLLIVGSGADQEPYLSAIANSPVRERIALTGQRTDAPQLIAMSDVLVQASTEGEGLPRSILEGLAYGVPAISTTAGGAKEVLKTGETGYIVPVRSPQAIAEAIRQLYVQREKLPAMAEHCKQSINNELSCTNSAKNYIAFFEQLVNAQ